VLELSTKISLTSATIKSPNICDHFSDEDLGRLGASCAAGYHRDKLSRLTWEKRNEAGMDLALQIQKNKTFPWPGASNVAFPLVTVAAMQFHARAYPALVSGKDVVRMEVDGPDPDGAKNARAKKVGGDMSWQVRHQDKGWEPGQDKLLLNLSIVGTTFKKSYYGAAERHNISEVVLAKDLVLDYWAKSVESCPRKTHLIPMSRNEIREKVIEGTYRDVLEEAWYKALPPNVTSTQRTKQDQRQGVTPPQPDETTTFQFGEQHVRLDLDGDGYAEPWIITFDIPSTTVVRIVAGFEEGDIQKATGGKYAGEIIRILSEEYFTKYSFIPSPDGGIYDIGFGTLLGPLNESTNSIINQIIDKGTLNNLGGGFLGRGAKIRGGAYTFAPGEWKRVDSTGDDLRKNVYPLPTSGDSPALFELLGLLISYTNRISGATDMMVGENPGQNTPAETSRLMAEMGQKIYNAIFKRVWLSTGAEFQKLYILNRKYGKLFGAIGPCGSTRDDYLGAETGVMPCADPNITSDVLAVQLATQVKQSAMSTPGYNLDEVEKMYLSALKVPSVEVLFPGTQGKPPGPSEKVQIQMLKNQQDDKALQEDRQQFIFSLLQDRELNQAKVAQLLASAQESLANANSEQSYARVAEINAAIAAARHEGEQLNSRIQAYLGAEKLRIEEKKVDKPEKAAA